MDFDLVSAYSARISWGGDFEAKNVTCYREGFSTSASCQSGELAVIVLNLFPDLSYNVMIESKQGEIREGTFSTASETSPNMKNLYKSLQNSDGIYDTTRLDKRVHDIFLAHFSSVVKPGDQILASVNVNGAQQEVMTVAVPDGSKVSVEDTSNSNLFLPFSKDNQDTMQAVTLVGGSDEATLAYDREIDAFGYGGEMYKVGDKFEMFGRTVTVADGSIVLLFSDTVMKTWPFQPAKALAVVGSAGSNFMTNLTAKVVNLVGSKADGETGSTYNSAWVHNTTDSTTMEITRMIHTLDEASENATLSLGVLHTDSNSNTFIEPCVQCSYDATTISAQNANDVTTSATFQSTGLSFDTDEASIYFGANQTFRIAFTDGTPATLKIESLDSVSGEYLTRFECSDSA